MREEGRQPVIARRKFRTSRRVGVPTALPDAENRTDNGAIFSTLHGSAPCHLTCCRRLACCTILYPLGEPNTPPALRRRECWPLQLQAEEPFIAISERIKSGTHLLMDESTPTVSLSYDATQADYRCRYRRRILRLFYPIYLDNRVYKKSFPKFFTSLRKKILDVMLLTT